MDIVDDVFGKLQYDDCWTKQFKIKMYDDEFNIPLCVEDIKKSYPQEEQKESFKYFIKNLEAIIYDSQYELYKYYNVSVKKEIGNSMTLPNINNKNDMKKISEPMMIYFPYHIHNNKNKIIFGIVFDCVWEEECGIAIKFIDDSIIIGTDDILY